MAVSQITSASIATGGVEPADLSTGGPSWNSAGNLSFNSGYGSVATAYGCRAWVNFNGQGTVAIRASGNISSITDGGVGTYTVNMANAMPDSNFGITTSVWDDGVSGLNSLNRTLAISSSSFYLFTFAPSGAGVDNFSVNAAVFR